MDLRWLWQKIRDTLKQVSFGRLMALLGVLGVLLILTLAIAFQPSPNPLGSSTVAAVRDRGVLRVAVRDSITRFSEYDAQTDSFSGLEVDFAHALARYIFDGRDRVELVPVNARTRTAKLDYGEADIAIAMYNGSVQSSSYLVSKPYYIDAYAVMVRRDTFASFESLNGRRIGVLQSSLSLQALAKLCQQRKLEYTYVDFASYSEMKEALNIGLVDAIVLEAGIMQSIYDTSKVLLDEAVSRVPYCVVAPKGSEALIQIANEVIDSMQKDGELRTLIIKWGLPDFTT